MSFKTYLTERVSFAKPIYMVQNEDGEYELVKASDYHKFDNVFVIESSVNKEKGTISFNGKDIWEVVIKGDELKSQWNDKWDKKLPKKVLKKVEKHVSQTLSIMRDILKSKEK